MSTEGWRRCCYCEGWFQPRPRNAYHQRFCSSPDCQVASKRASQLKWSHRNPGYFHGEQYVRKVQAWRRRNPGYWRTKREAAECGPLDALQDLLTAQGFGNEEVKTFRTCLSEEITRPLQDVLFADTKVAVFAAKEHLPVKPVDQGAGGNLNLDDPLALDLLRGRGQQVSWPTTRRAAWWARMPTSCCAISP
jgi:hypothetical protein